jgi:hypothetical protein
MNMGLLLVHRVVPIATHVPLKIQQHAVLLGRLSKHHVFAMIRTIIESTTILHNAINVLLACCAQDSAQLFQSLTRHDGKSYKLPQTTTIGLHTALKIINTQISIPISPQVILIISF